MKIIATVSEEQLMVQISKEELSHLMGFYSERDLPSNHRDCFGKTFRIGQEIPISSVYESIRYLCAKSKDSGYSDTLKSIKRQIKELGESLEVVEKGIQPIVEKATEGFKQ